VIPVDILRGLGIVQFSGGRGLLAFTDLDTAFNVLTFLAVGTVLYRNRATLNRPYAIAIAGLALGLVLLMGYVVTNFGTLFRLRSMAMALVWLLPLAIARRAPAHPQALV
jgi:hypothetical protein